MEWNSLRRTKTLMGCAHFASLTRNVLATEGVKSQEATTPPCLGIVPGKGRRHPAQGLSQASDQMQHPTDVGPPWGLENQLHPQLLQDAPEGPHHSLRGVS